MAKLDKLTRGTPIERAGQIIGYVTRNTSFRYFAYSHTRDFIGEAPNRAGALHLVEERYDFNLAEDARVSAALAVQGIFPPKA